MRLDNSDGDIVKYMNDKPKVELIIILPFLEDKTSFSELIAKLSVQVSDSHIVLVDDGSLENSLDLDFLDDYFQSWTQIKLRRNAGAQRAIAVGLNYVNNNFDYSRVLIMDSDGEDSPETVKGLLEYHLTRKPKSEICVVTRKDRNNSPIFKFLYTLYKAFFWTYTGKQMNFGHYSVLTREAVSRIINYPQIWIHLGSTYLLARIPISYYSLNRGKRYDGESRLNLNSLVQHGLRSVVAQSELVISRVIVFISILLFTSFTIAGTGFVLNSYLLLILGALVFFVAQSIVTITSLIMLLSISRNSGEYDSTNFESLIKDVDSSSTK